MQPDLTSCEVCHLLSQWTTASRFTELGALIPHQHVVCVCSRQAGVQPGRGPLAPGEPGAVLRDMTPRGWTPAGGHQGMACPHGRGSGMAVTSPVCGLSTSLYPSQRISPAAQRPVCTSQRVPITVPGTEEAKGGPWPGCLWSWGWNPGPGSPTVQGEQMDVSLLPTLSVGLGGLGKLLLWPGGR